MFDLRLQRVLTLVMVLIDMTRETPREQKAIWTVNLGGGRIEEGEALEKKRKNYVFLLKFKEEEEEGK